METINTMVSGKEAYLEVFDSIDFHAIKDHPNILIAANFWENDRYCAAKTFYKFMRAIDDLIDNHKAENKKIDPAERQKFVANVNEWLKMIIESKDCNPLQKEIITTVEKYHIPLWPLRAFARSMIYDINNDGFPTLDSFIEYSQGASVAPASIFVHLNGLTKKEGRYMPPAFDLKEASTPCAIFSYLVHIIRDFQKDQLNNLNYFADDVLTKHRLTRHDLKEIAYGHPVPAGFREVIKEYYDLATQYKNKTYEVIERIAPHLEPRYQLSLEIIFDLYIMVYERIDAMSGTFTAEELNPTPDETRERVHRLIINFSPR